MWRVIERAVSRPASRLWIGVPIVAMAAIQLASGLPDPDHFSASGQSPLEASAARILLAPDHRTLNVLHVPVFAVLAWLWCWSLGPWVASRRRGAMIAVAVCLGFAIWNEMSQMIVPTRYASLFDVGLNALGVALGLAVFLMVFPEA